MKKILKSIIVISFLLPLFSFNVLANEDEIENVSYYKENNIILETKKENFDWNGVTEIQVVYARLDDPFIVEALNKGVNVRFEDSVLLRAGFQYFSRITWITRNNIRSLSVTLKNQWTAPKEASWSELYNYFVYHPYYTSEGNVSKLSSMYNQYVCHADYARAKQPWNIEPSTADKGYWGFVSSGCN